MVIQFLKICRKILFFGPSLIHQLWLLGSQQHPQSGVLLTSFSTWWSENSLAEINLESMGVLKGCIIFLGVKNLQLQLCGRAHYHATRKSIESRTQLDEPIECASGGDPLFLYKILHLLFSLWYELLVHYALRVKKIINLVLMRDLWNFSFFGWEDVSSTHSELCRFVSWS